MSNSSAGIYIITNNKNKKAYIGSTTNFKRRWDEHHSTLYRNIHANSHLQGAWNKYGEESFEFGILEYLDNPEELHLAEQFWFDIYRLEDKELYNYGLAARCPMLGRTRSEETRKKISNSHKGRVFSEKHCQNISKACKGRTISKEHLQKLVALHKGKPLSKEHRRKIGEANAKSYPIFIHRVTGEVIPAGYNLAALCRERELNRGHMREVMHGKRNHHQGWTRYYKELRNE